MKTAIPLLIISFCSLYALGQDAIGVKTTYFKEPEQQGSRAPYGIIGGDETGTYFFEHEFSNKRNLLIKFNEQNQKILEIKVDGKVDETHTLIHPMVYYVQGQIWIIGNSPVKGGKYQLIARELNKKTFEYIGPTQTFDMEVMGPIKNIRATAELSVVRPISGNCLLLLQGEPRNQQITVVNSKLEVLRSGLFFDFAQMPKTSYSNSDLLGARDVSMYSLEKNWNTKSDVQSVLYDRKGNLFIDYKDSTATSYVKVYLAGHNSPVTSLLDDNSTSSTSTLAELPNGDVVCAGFYMNSNTPLPQGTLYAKIDLVTGSVGEIVRNKFQETTIKNLPNQTVNKGFHMGKGVSEHNYRVHPVMVDSSSIYLSFEHEFSYVADLTPSNAASKVVYNVSYKDNLEIVVAKLNSSSGALVSQSLIPRWLRCDYMFLMSPESFSLVIKDGICRVLYIDRITNLTQLDIKDMSFVYPEVNNAKLIERKQHYGAIICATIHDGTSFERSLVHEYTVAEIIHPLEAYRMSNSQLLVPAYKTDEHSATSSLFTGLTLITLP